MDDNDITYTSSKSASDGREDVPTSKGLESTGVGKPIPRGKAREFGGTGEVPMPRPTGYSGRHTPYIRQPRPRKTQEAINDMEQDETYSVGFAHDSNVAVGGNTPLSGLGYRRSRADMGKLQRDLHYGQYLEIPKGKRQIFSSREREQQIRSRAITVGVVAFLIVAFIIILRISLG
ncbi:MAG: hypothetical protein PUD09_05945 [Coriobacteriales bacterium]|nr:hypothetical protein [Coriobacteriales bacterium]